MTTDNGIMAKIETWAIGILAALTDDNGDAIFKTADHWQCQIADGGSGAETMDRHAPYALVKCAPLGARREGGYDLNNRLTLGVLIGQTSRAAGIARIGDGNKLGTSELHDKVRDALNEQHPGSGITTDDFYYTGGNEMLESEKRHVMQLTFEADYMQD